MRAAWLLSALPLSAALAALNLYAFQEYLYWKYEWFDVYMHTLGGVAIGTFLVGIVWRFRPTLYVFLFYVIILAWELFEYHFGIPRDQNYVFDTTVDVLTGTLGALLVYLIARLSVWKR